MNTRAQVGDIGIAGILGYCKVLQGKVGQESD